MASLTDIVVKFVTQEIDASSPPPRAVVLDEDGGVLGTAHWEPALGIYVIEGPMAVIVASGADAGGDDIAVGGADEASGIPLVRAGARVGTATRLVVAEASLEADGPNGLPRAPRVIAVPLPPSAQPDPEAALGDGPWSDPAEADTVLTEDGRHVCVHLPHPALPGVYVRLPGRDFLDLHVVRPSTCTVGSDVLVFSVDDDGEPIAESLLTLDDSVASTRYSAWPGSAWVGAKCAGECPADCPCELRYANA
ncbi:hypothetical protein ET445_03505 [Agromyces protaetiae]|uniref:Uncharacterized protein n=1 Tax=Agromyces protaetiae TaxID=2509455 RepID=A0A4P6FPV8_9MICO|nr:hypothetical protein [Agromyces protaetiae]QAY72548.1 hypothetical protein ET445_03505 [Agromyces protaetiae]